VIFNSLTFVVFFAVVYALYRLLPGWGAKKNLLLVASYWSSADTSTCHGIGRRRQSQRIAVWAGASAARATIAWSHTVKDAPSIQRHPSMRTQQSQYLGILKSSHVRAFPSLIPGS
jgi:hypothetical protein